MHIIQGIWYTADGFRNHDATAAAIDVVDGVPFDAELPREFGALTVDDSGHLRGWADGYFWPAPGELARVGVRR